MSSSSLPDSSEARAEILRRIRAADAGRMPSVEVQRDYELSLGGDIDRVGLFVERVADYQAVVRRVTAGGLAKQISASLGERGARRIVVPEGLEPAWLKRSQVEFVGDDPPIGKEDLDAMDGVITTCAIAIAETGTIVLDGGPGQGRRALSLLPDYHLCIVAAHRIVGTVPEALEQLDAHRAQTWISGPSATSDIELQRVEGVHGPRNLEVLIVD